jgi:hypothetical protein
MTQLMWTKEPVGLRPPNLLFTAATGADFAAWRVANPWADAIEAIVFQADREGDVKLLGHPYAAANPDVPWRVIGAGPPFNLYSLPGALMRSRKFFENVYALRGIAGGTFVEAVERHRVAVRHIAAITRGRIPCWTIMAEADGGALAVEVAAAHGRHVALSASPNPPLMATSMAVERGVSILSQEKSNAHLFNRFMDEERQKREGDIKIPPGEIH